MQNPGDDECAQPVPRFYVTLRDTSEGRGDRATACNGRDRDGSGGRRALRPSGGLGRGWTESRAPDPRRVTMLGTCHDSRVKLSAPLSGR